MASPTAPSINSGSSSAELDGLYRYLYNNADRMRTAGDTVGAKALLYHILKQKDVSKRQRKDAQLLLAVISYGSDAPSSQKKLKFRSVCLRSLHRIKTIALAPVKLVLGSNRAPRETSAQVLAYHNQVRADRLRRAGQAEQEDQSAADRPESKGKGKAT